MRIFFLIVLFFSIKLNSQNWVWQNPLPQGNSLKDIFLINEEITFAVGENGTVIKTTDGGNNWLTLHTGITTKLTSSFFMNGDTGFAVGDNGIILKTINSGLSFTQLISNTTTDLHTINFLDEHTGYAAGANGVIIYSSDSGANWILKQNEDTRTISDIFFISNSKGWYVGEEGLIKMTNDAGNTWVTQNSYTTNILSSIFFLNEESGWICGIDGSILKTTNEGNTWEIINANISNWLKSISFFDINNGITVGSPGIILNTSDGGNSWTENSSPNSFNLNCVSVNNQTSLIISDNGLIIKSIDKGLNWEFLSDGWYANINDIFFYNENEGIAVGDDGLIITTTNSGDTWINQVSGVTKNLNAVGYFSGKPNQVWVVGDSATVLFSADKGLNWSAEYLTNLTISNLNGISVSSFFVKIVCNRAVMLEKAIRYNTGWYKLGLASNTLQNFKDTFYSSVVGENGTIGRLISANGSILLETFIFPDVDDLNDIFFINRDLGWIVGKYGVVLKSSTGGYHWNLLTQIEVNALNSIIFLNNNIGLTVGTNGSLFKSINGGVNWEKINTGLTNLLKRVFFINENIGWILGTNGIILKTTNGGGVSTEIKNEMISKASDFFLSQNYPNPFNSLTNIVFTIPRASLVNLSVYSILGNEIDCLINEVKPAGQYSVEFNANDLSSGIYFYRLFTDNFSETKKLLLIK